MKTHLLTAMVLTLSFLNNAALAAIPETVRIVRSKAEYPITAALNPKTVRCLVGDYGSSSLKISLPELKGLTVFRHTTRGEVEPCINAGACKTQWYPDGLTPEQVLNPAEPTENINVEVVLEEVLTLNHDAKTCERNLEERVFSKVRGLNFRHQDGRFLGELDYKLCLAMIHH